MGQGLVHGPFSAIVNGVVETLGADYANFFSKHAAEPGSEVQIPALKFTVKDSPALRGGPKTLVDLKCSSRFGIKFVGISKRGKGRTISSIDYPGARDTLKAGYECWVLPILADYVVIDDEVSAASRLLEACDPFYRVGDGDSVEVREGTGLHSFMEEFSLQPEDLMLQRLRGCLVKYTGSRAASICTRPYAEHILLQLRKAYWMSSSRKAFACLLKRFALVQDDSFVLWGLNMRNNFEISPLAVVHGGEGWCGFWELPEKTTTILCPGDRLIFLPPPPLQEETFRVCSERLNDETFLSTLDCVRKALEDPNVFPGSAVEPKAQDPRTSVSPDAAPKPKAKRRTRRGRGGSRRQQAEEADLALPAGMRTPNIFDD